jgi:hypothetical protein
MSTLDNNHCLLTLAFENHQLPGFGSKSGPICTSINRREKIASGRSSGAKGGKPDTVLQSRTFK